MKTVILRAALALSVIGMVPAGEASAATQLVNGAGKLTGATGVVVDGQTYNVTFVDGTCTSAYGTCANSAFAFTSLNSAINAAAALQSQVFLDTGAGNYDTQAGLTLGCLDGVSFCSAYIPYSADSTSFDFAFATNNNIEPGDVYFFGSSFINQLDSSTMGNSVFARFQLASAVPEPASWAMMLLGFGMIAGAARYRRRSANVTYA